MSKFENFTYRSPYGVYEDCSYVTGKYYNGNPALQIMSPEGPVCTCSVNPPDEILLAEGEIAIKDWSENQGMGNWLKLHGVIVREDPVRRIPSGFVTIPVYRLTDAGKALFAA